MKKLLIATFNPGKQREIRAFLSDISFELLVPQDLGLLDNLEETGKTFEENAILKAQFYSHETNLPAISDDGGLEIDALDGAPGVYSKRWIGKKNATTEDYIDFVLEKMKHIPEGKRGAQLRTVVALCFPFQDRPENTKDKVYTVSAAVRGIIPIVPSIHRENGFPYRSLLFIPELGKFYNHAEMTKKEEEKYNHRKIALQELKKIIYGKIINN